MGRYFDRKELSPISQAQLPAHGTNIRVTALMPRADYAKDTVDRLSAGDSQA